MTDSLSPKQVARAIGVSESSLKRWCDRGLLPTVKTVGGHRRLSLTGVLQFLKETGRELAQPEILGLPSAVGSGSRVLATASDELALALLAGKEAVARQIVLDLFLQQHRLAAICDEVIAKAFYEIGEQWECAQAEIYEERRGCEIALRVLHELRHLVPEGRQCHLAIGGTSAGDHYQIPTAMVELILRENGYRTCSLGTNIPFESLETSLLRDRPQLFWLSVSAIADCKTFVEDFNSFYETALSLKIPLVVGGRALTQDIRCQLRFTTFCDTLQHLESYLKTTIN